MSPEQYERLEQLFLEARALPGDRRAGFLEAVSRREPGLRIELDRLLSHDERPNGAIDALAGGGAARILANALDDSRLAPLDANAFTSQAAPLPRQIGPYIIVRLIGQGGMGAVYEAEQDDPKRRVALKVIRDGFTSPHLLERFHREAQMLGRLRHRGIAQIYDAHTAPVSGRPPYIVMELIEGPPLLKFAELQRLDTRQRLELIAEIADALEHAHRGGLIHRDLKPGNILVEPRTTPATCGSGMFDSIEARIGGQPKILDFGVARSADLQTLTGEADTGRLIGTVPYMSPEQAAGQRLDVRSDLYSLGVVAFELLTGRLPYGLTGKMLHEAARIIRDEEPTRPGAIDRRLRGDVEVIVGRALEKDRERRYATASDLAADIRRHLSDQPIVARPPSLAYRVRKLVKRRRAVAAGVAIAVTTVMIAGVISLRHIAATRRADAETQRQRTIAAEEAWRTYVGAIVSAAAAVENHDPDLAVQFLSAANQGRDTWEYRHVTARLAAYGSLMEAQTPIAAAAFDEDDGALVTASRAGLIQWWDAPTATLRRAISLVQEIAGPAVFSENGEWLVTAVGPAAADVVIWHSETGSEFARLTSAEIAAALERNYAATVTAIAISPDGGRVALGAEGGVLWRPGDGERFGWLCGTHVTALAFSDDGARFVCGYREPEIRETAFIRAFDADVAGPVDRRLGFPYRVKSLAVPGGGEIALVGTGKNNAKFVILKTGRKRPSYGPGIQVDAVAVDPRDNRILPRQAAGLPVATATPDGLIGVYHRNSHALLRRFAGPGGRVSQLAFSSDGARLLSVAGRFVRVYHVEPLDAITVLRGHESPVACVAFLDDARLVSVGLDGALRIWNPWSGAVVADAPTSADSACRLAISPAAGLLAAGHDGGRVRIWNAETAEALGDLETGTDANITGVAVSADAARLASRIAKRLTVWDPTSARPLWSATLDGSNAPAPLVFSPDGALVAAGVGDRVHVWDAVAGEPLVALDAHAGLVVSLAFSPDRGQLVSGSSEGTLCIWELRSGTKQAAVKRHAGVIRAVAFTPDGARLASGSDDRSVVLWDTTRWEPVLTLTGHTGGVTALAFSPEGARLASGSIDQTIRVWDSTPLR